VLLFYWHRDWLAIPEGEGLLFLWKIYEVNRNQESLESKKNERDYGLIVGASITAWFRKLFNIPKRAEKHPEREPLLAQRKNSSDEESLASASPGEIQPEPSIRDILSPQTTLNLVVYTLLALHTLAYDQVRHFARLWCSTY